MTDPTSFIFPPPDTGFSLDKVSYVHPQGTPTTLWVIEHNLGYHPNFTIIDSGGNEIEGDPTFVSPNILHVEFSFATGGTAYLS